METITEREFTYTEYKELIKRREIDLVKIVNEEKEVELTTEDVNTEIKERESKLLEEAKAEYEKLGTDIEAATTRLDAAKAVLADRKSVLRELKDKEYWPNGYTNSTSPTVEEEEEETIIDTTPEDTETIVENNVAVITKEEGFKATTLNIGGNYIIIEKPINSYQIGQIGKALKTIDREAALDIINNTLLDYLSDKQYQALKKRLKLEDIVV